LVRVFHEKIERTKHSAGFHLISGPAYYLHPSAWILRKRRRPGLGVEPPQSITELFLRSAHCSYMGFVIAESMRG
jgi:hypothetical protein